MGKGKSFETGVKVAKLANRQGDQATAEGHEAKNRGDSALAKQKFAYAMHGYGRAERALLGAAEALEREYKDDPCWGGPSKKGKRR